MDDINRVTGEDDSLNKENSLTETDALGDGTETGDVGGGLSEGMATPVDDLGTGTGFGERLDTDPDDTAGFDDTAGDTEDTGLVDKAKDKYREIMSDDK
jgi:hypothetical protein